MRQPLSNFVLVMLFLSSFSFSIGQDTLRVPAQISTIQAALNMATSGTTILVSPGTYEEELKWPESVDGIQLIGEEGSAETFLSGQDQYRVLTLKGEQDSLGMRIISRDTKIKGFSITNGFARKEGGGLYVEDANPELQDLYVDNNALLESGKGGAAFISKFSGHIEDCTFRTLNSIPQSIKGGGLYLLNSNCDIINCDFSSITNLHGQGGGAFIKDYSGKILNSNFSGTLNFSNDFIGVGLYIIDASCDIIDCNFDGNQSFKQTSGVGAYMEYVIGEISSCTFSRNISAVSSMEGESEGVGLYLSSFTGDINDCEFNENSAYGGNGIGLYAEDFEGDLSGCLFESNSSQAKDENSTFGIGAYLECYSCDDPIALDSCRFVANNGTDRSELSGGGVYIEADGIELKNCLFESNWLTSESKAEGGALSTRADSLRIVGCDFIDNSVYADEGSGDFQFADKFYGGAIHISWVEKTFVNDCNLIKNRADKGSAIYIPFGTIQIENSILNSNGNNPENITICEEGCGFAINAEWNDTLALKNCIVYDNDGGSVRLRGGTSSQIRIDHCTIVDNHGPLSVDESQATATNSIFWNNESDEIISEPAGNATLSSCVVQGGYPGLNIIEADPLLITDSLIYPGPGSPCLGAGTDSDITIDLIGNSRPLPLGSSPDIGAMEVDQPTSLEQLIELVVELSPNPTTGILNFSRFQDHIAVYDVKGNSLVTKSFSDQIDIRSLPAGLYLIQAQQDGKYSTHRVILY